MHPSAADLFAFFADTAVRLLDLMNRLEVCTDLFGHSEALRSVDYSASTRCTNDIAIEPSPTADASRLMFPARTSPTAKTPGLLLTSKSGARASGQCAASSSSRARCGPVL